MTTVRRLRPRAGLQIRLVRWHLAVLCAMTTLLVGVQTWQLYGDSRERLGERALTTSRLVASLPEVVDGAASGQPNPALNARINSLRGAAEADFIVVGDRMGIRLAHPVAERLGLPMEGGDNVEPFAGREVVSVARGSLGVSVRGKVPVWQTGEVVGVVSTGYLMPQVWNLVGQALRGLLPWFVLALGLGTLGAVWAARRLRAEILNLEPEEIAALARQQSAVLAALREGVIAVDAVGQVTLVSDRAAEALGERPTPYPLSEVWPELAALTRGGVAARQQNLELALSGAPLLVNLEPLSGGGFVSGFRDRAQALELAEELTHARGFVDVLRAQTHEYQNRLHVISGLLQLERPEEALRVLNAEICSDAEFRQLLKDVQVPRLVALLAGKRERAQELGIAFVVAGGSHLSPIGERHAATLVTAVGNLTENAFEALAGQPGTVTVSIGEDPDGVQIEVEDSGPGVPAALSEQLFVRGVSSKGEGRGHGLAGVLDRVSALGGQLRHHRRGAVTVFEDDSRVARVNRDLLERELAVHVVGSAASCTQGDVLVRALQPDLILLDVHLPDGSGLGLLHHWRAAGLLTDVALITAAAAEASVRLALAHGAFDYLIKPFTGARLAELVARHRARRPAGAGGLRLDQA